MQSLQDTRYLRIGLIAAWVFHALFAVTMAYVRTRRSTDFVVVAETMDQQITILASFSEAATEQFEENLTGAPILVTPTLAQFEDHTFVETPAVAISLEAMISEQQFEEDLQEQADVDVYRVRAQELAKAVREPMIDHLIPRATKLHRSPPPEVVEAETVEPPREVVRQSSHASLPPMVSTTVESQAKLIAPDFSPASGFNNRPPHFPDQARRQGWQGNVTLSVTVNVRGRVTNVQVKQSSGHALLDAAAVTTIRSWVGKPATRDGVPVESTWSLPVRFQQ